MVMQLRTLISVGFTMDTTMKMIQSRTCIYTSQETANHEHTHSCILYTRIMFTYHFVLIHFHKHIICVGFNMYYCSGWLHSYGKVRQVACMVTSEVWNKMCLYQADWPFPLMASGSCTYVYAWMLLLLHGQVVYTHMHFFSNCCCPCLIFWCPLDCI